MKSVIVSMPGMDGYMDGWIDEGMHACMDE